MVSEPVTTNGRAIRRYRMLAGLSNAEVAERAGISTSYLANIESGRRGGSGAVIRRIAEALGRPVADLRHDHMAAA